MKIWYNQIASSIVTHGIGGTIVPHGRQAALFYLIMKCREVLCNDPYIRQVYSTTGNCRFHCRGYAPNNTTLSSHVRYLYNHTKGIRRLECQIIMATYMDLDRGVEYEKYQESEHLER